VVSENIEDKFLKKKNKSICGIKSKKGKSPLLFILKIKRVKWNT